MNYLREIEDDIKNIGNEAKSKYPLVKEAADRALVALKTIRDSYVSDIMKKSKDEKTVKFPQSSDVLAPYMLACNYADGGNKLITMALNGIHMLLNFDMIPPSDVQNILRVLSIQAASNKFDMQLKLLQILLCMANALSKDPESSQYLTENTICSFLTLSLQICDGNGKGNVSVSTTALGTVRQLIALVMDGALNLFLKTREESDYHNLKRTHSGSTAFTVSMEQASSSFSLSAIMLIREMCLFIQGLSGEWIRGTSIPQAFALDLMYEVLTGWKFLFVNIPSYKVLLHDCICPALKPLLRCLQDDYLITAARSGVTTAASFTSRVVRIARCILLNFVTPELYGDVEFILTLLVHSLQPDRGGGGTGSSAQLVGRGAKSPAASSAPPEDPSFRARFEEASQMIPGAGALISRLAGPIGIAAGAINNVQKSFGGGGGAQPTTPGGGRDLPRPNMATLATFPNFYVLLSSGLPVPASSATSSVTGTTVNTIQIPAHPAAVCLEAILSFLLCGEQIHLMRTDSHLQLIETLMVSVSVSVSGLLTSALAVDLNVADMDMCLRKSKLKSLLKDVMSNATPESKPSADSIARALSEYMMASPGAKPTDVFLLCFTLLQLVPRILLRVSLQLSLYNTSSANEAQVRQINGAVFVSSTLKGLLPMSKEESAAFLDMSPRVKSTLARVCEFVYETTWDAGEALLLWVENAYVIRSVYGMTSELAITAGVLGLSVVNKKLVSQLCQRMVPLWHGKELFPASRPLEQRDLSVKDPSSPLPGPDLTYRWRHAQALIRVFQVVHATADVISDWDDIVDGIEQVIDQISVSEFKSAVVEPMVGATGKAEGAPVEIDKIFTAIERFKVYSVFMSDDALVKLMASLVSQTMNTAGVSATISRSAPSTGRLSGSGPTAPAIEPAGGTSVNAIRARITSGPNYLVSGVTSGTISFCLQAAIEVTKLNTFRISTVWQMVTSNLREIAKIKSAKLRSVSVAATHDVILTALKYLQNSTSPIANLAFLKEEVFPAPPPGVPAEPVLSDDQVFAHILPPFETVFMARDFHRSLSISRNQVLLYNPKLSQSDLLSSLRSLSMVRYGDVRNDILSGLSSLLQSRGQSVDQGAWLVIVDILGSVPASMSTDAFLKECYSEDRDSDEEDEDASPAAGDSVAAKTSYQWPRESLHLSFECMTLIVEEFLDIIITNTEIVKSILQCLSVFSSQLKDVNISFTSVEMLWKVTDMSINASRLAADGSLDRQYVESVFDAMLKRLFLLSVDNRPEIRDCAINTLFSAMAAHAQIISPNQWKQVFENIIFPLFSRTDARSKLAISTGEEAQAPELKKGVRMNVHHSRDTAHKQWSGTRVLALRGLTRMMRTCTKLLLEEIWFREVWVDSITVCHEALQSACEDQEVSVAGLDVIISMLRIITGMDAAPAAAEATPTKAGGLHGKPPSFKRDSGESLQVQEEKARLSKIGISQESYSLKEKGERVEKSKQHLWSLAWTALHDAAFFGCPSVELSHAIVQKLTELYKSRVDKEFKQPDNLRELLEMVTTVVRPRIVVNNGSTDSVSAKQDRVAESQLQRGVMDLLREVPIDVSSFSLLVSTLTEICFAIGWVEVKSPLTDDLMVLGSVPDKLRVDAGDHLILIQHAFTQLTETGETKPPPAEKGKPHFLVASPHYAPLMLDLVSRRFLCDLCEVPLTSRCDAIKAVSPPAAASPLRTPLKDARRPSASAAQVEADASAASSSSSSSSSGSSPSTAGNSGFFFSIANMISPLNTSASAPSGKHESLSKHGPASASFSLHKFPRYASPSADMTLSQKHTLRFSSPSSSAKFEERGQVWRSFLCLDIEARVLDHALLGIIANSRHGSESLTEAMWCNVLTCLACLLSPWLRSEILQRDEMDSEAEAERAVEQFGVMTRTTLKLLDTVMKLVTSNPRFPSTWTMSLLTMLCQSTVLGVYSVVVSSDLSAAAAGTFESYLQLWLKVKDVLCDVVDAAVNYFDIDTRKCALNRLLFVTKEVSHYIHHSESQLPQEVYSVCCELLAGAVDLNVPLMFLQYSEAEGAFSLQTSAASPSDAKYCEELLAQWLRACVLSRVPDEATSTHSSDKTPTATPSNRKQTSVQFSDSTTSGLSDNKSHLMLLMASAVDLIISCPHPRIKEIAARVVRYTDMQKLINTLTHLTTRNAELEGQNRELRAEIVAVKSAASLPF